MCKCLIKKYTQNFIEIYFLFISIYKCEMIYFPIYRTLSLIYIYNNINQYIN